LKNLPERPSNVVKPGDADPIGAMIEAVETVAVTGSVRKPENQQGPVQ
jgi:hypothetical protein